MLPADSKTRKAHAALSYALRRTNLREENVALHSAATTERSNHRLRSTVGDHAAASSDGQMVDRGVSPRCMVQINGRSAGDRG
jgi:hypothetical protein